MKMNLNDSNIELYSNKNKGEYENFLLKSPNACIHHNIEWKEFLEEYFSFKPYYLTARDNEDNIRAVLPLFYLKNFYGKRLDSLPCSVYAGILGDERYIRSLIEAACDFKEKLSCKCVIIRQSPPGFDNSFENHGMRKDEGCLSQWIEIKHPDIFWSAITSSNRNRIRNARKHNIKVERVTNKEDLRYIYRLEITNGKRLGIPIPGLDFFERLWNKMHKKGFVEAFIAKRDGMVVASTLIFPFNKKVICRISNSDFNNRKHGANNLLFWETINWCYNKGYKFFDFGATDIDNHGLIFFKSSFNTINTPFAYYYFPKNQRPIRGSSFDKIGRIFYSKLPKVMHEKAGPTLVKKFF